MPKYIIAAGLILTGVYLLMLGFKKKPSKDKLWDLHTPIIASNYKIRYKVLGVIVILAGLTVLLN